MRAWQQHQHGEPSTVLQLADLPNLRADEGQLVIEPEMVGLSMPDVLLCRGEYQSGAPFPFTVGGEVAGLVVDAPGRSSFTIGQRVMATRVNPGGLATRVVADETLTDAVPDDVPPEVVASIPVNYVTAHLALHHRARIANGETVVVIGGAGGVGSAAIQLALAAEAQVIATAVDDARLDACRALGAHTVIDANSEDVPQAVLDATDGRGADIIVDPVGGDAFDDARRCIAFDGRVVVVGFVGGRIASLRTNHLMLRSFSAVGVNNGQTMIHRPEVHRATRVDCLSLAASNQISPLIAGIWPFERAAAALDAIAKGSVVGKALVKVS